MENNPTTAPCPACGAALPDEANFCSSCGAARPNVTLGQTIRLAPPAPADSLRSGRCPICHDTAVYMHHAGFVGHIEIKLPDVGPLKKSLDTYICTSCGYVELFLPQDAAHHMSAIQRHWRAVAPQNP